MTITLVQAVLYTCIAIAFGAAPWAAFVGRSLRRLLLGLGMSAAALLVAGITMLAGMGAFCIPPPGAACA